MNEHEIKVKFPFLSCTGFLTSARDMWLLSGTAGPHSEYPTEGWIRGAGIFVHRLQSVIGWGLLLAAQACLRLGSGRGNSGKQRKPRWLVVGGHCSVPRCKAQRDQNKGESGCVVGIQNKRESSGVETEFIGCGKREREVETDRERNQVWFCSSWLTTV